MKQIFTMIFMLFFFSSVFSQTNWYVATNGNNNNPGTESQPFLTIQKGVDMAQAGDVVFVKAGTYNEEVSVKNSGTAGNPVKLMAYPGDELQVIIDGSGINVSKNSAWPYFSGLIGAYGKSYIEVSGFSIQNSNDFGLLAYQADNIIFKDCYTFNTAHSGIASFEDCSNIYILNNEVVFAVNGGQQECISVATTDGFEVGYNKVYDASEAGFGGEGIDIKDGSANGKVFYNEIWNTPSDRTGIYIDAYEKHTHNIDIYGNIIHDSRHFGLQMCSEKGGLLENIRIYNNIIYNSKRGGIQFFDESSHSGPEPIQNIEIYNNTFYNNSPTINWWGGITNNSGYVSDVYIHNNIFAYNNAYQVFDEAVANGWYVSNNLLIGDLGSQDQNRLNAGDDLQGDPQFVNAGSFDFHLTNSSPAIDNGIASFVEDDYDGNPRPSGAGWDIGAFEFNLGPSCNPTISVIGESTLCHDGTLTLDAGEGFASYNWSTGESTQIIQISQSGEYTVSTVDGGGCDGSASVNIAFPEALSLSISASNAVGGNNGSVNLTVTGGTSPYSYLWSNGETNPDISGLAPGIYSVVVTDDHGCSAEESVTIEYVEPAELAFEHGIINNVTENWQTIYYENTYVSPVVIASVQLPSADFKPVVARIRNAGTSGFDVKIQGAGITANNNYNVHYFVVEEGVYTLADDGIKMEALKANSAETAKSGKWVRENRNLQNAYSNPVVLGQVMTANDEDWSVFWASSNSNFKNPPQNGNMACGKHIGEGTGSRLDETIGIVVFEAGNGNLGGTEILTGLGNDIVRGPTNSASGYTYDISALENPTTAIVSAAGMDGANGGWPVLFTENPVSNGNLVLAFDEDIESDTERNHTTEQVAYLVFEGQTQQPEHPTAEYGFLDNVSTTWQTVSLAEHFTNPVIVATPVIQNSADPSIVTRIQNVTSTGFDLKVENPSGSTVDGISAYYLAVEEGVYNLTDHGINMEAVVTNSPVIARKNNWVTEARAYQNSYDNPVVVGQVMSANDNWSVFWASLDGSKNTPPSATSFAAGRHIGEDQNTNRNPETIGYIVFEAGLGNIGSLSFEAGITSDFVRGLDNSSTGYNFTPNNLSTLDCAVLSAAGMDGGDGGFPVLFGENPFDNGSFNLSFAEDRINDNERKHTTEQVAYVAFGNPGTKSQIINQQIQSSMEEMLVFPNPAEDIVTLRLENISQSSIDIYIYDLMGRGLYNTTIREENGQFNLSVNHLSKGIYLVRVKAGGNIYSGKLIKK